MYWLNFGSGFHLVLPRSSPRLSEASAARAAVRVASLGNQRAAVLEAGLRTLIQQYQNFPTLTGRTFWVFSLRPANPRIVDRWFFVLVDAQNGRVARVYDQMTVVRLSGHVPGEPPLVRLPGVPSAQQAMFGLLLYGSNGHPPVSRQEAIALARQMSFVLGGAASPASNRRATAILARPWPFDGTLDWFVTQRVFRSARGGRRSPAIQFVRVDALTGKLVSSFCCFTPTGAAP